MFANWLIQITCIIIVSVLADIILSEGETKKFIKGIIALFVALAIFSPIPKLLNQKADIFNFDYNTYEQTQSGLIDSISKSKVESLKKTLNNKYMAMGVYEAKIDLNYVLDGGDVKIINININLNNAVINSEKLNIDIIMNIKTITSDSLLISKEMVNVIYERKI